MFKILKAAVWKTVANTNVIHIWKSGAWKTVTRMRIWKTHDGAVGWRDFYVKDGTSPPAPPPPGPPPPPPPPPLILDVTISPSTASGYATTTGSGAFVTTAPDSVASVSNGTGPYTYQWVRVSWSNNVPTILSPNSAATRFRMLLDVDTTEYARFKVIAQDSLGNTGEATIDAQFTLSARDWDVGSNL